MKNIQKRIAALSVASAMLASASGCADKKIKYRYNEETKQEELVGNITLNDVNNYYIVELKNIDESRALYLTYYYDTLLVGFLGFKNIGSNNYIVEPKNLNNIYSSDFWAFVKAIPLSYFLSCYDMVKNNYEARELLEVFEKVKQDYDKFTFDENVKVLTKTIESVK